MNNETENKQESINQVGVTPSKKIRKGRTNSGLHKKSSKNEKNEYITRLFDIEQEMKNYKSHFENKIILCNCGDDQSSNFWKYFSLNFKVLGLKKLIAISYKHEGQATKIEMSRGSDDSCEPIITQTQMTGDGDFENPESMNIMLDADIIVTNPPFNKFKEYIAQLIEWEKQFIIVGNQNAITYKETFKIIKSGLVWLGVNQIKSLISPEGKESLFGNVLWFTNLSHSKQSIPLHLVNQYKGNEARYPKYDNYNAIEVSLVRDIPEDYEGVMGVPITFLNNYKPDFFTILGMASSAGYNAEVVGIPFLGSKDARPLLDGQNTFARIFIQNKKPVVSSGIDDSEVA